MNIRLLINWISALITITAFVSCNKNLDFYNTDESDEIIKKENFFEFKTSCKCTLNIVNASDFKVSYAVFSQNPYQETEDFTQATPVFAGFSDDDGNINDSFNLPSFVTKLWIVINHVLTESPIEVDIHNNTAYVNYKDYVEKLKTNSVYSRGILQNGLTYPQGFSVIGEWDENGTPDYLMGNKITLPAGFLKRCSDFVTSTNFKNILERNPSLKSTSSNEIVIKKETSLIASYFATSPALNDVLAYYTYQEGESLDINNIRKTILFPRFNNSVNGMAGKQVKLQYWNSNTQSYQDKFPAGTHIGWILVKYYNENSWMHHEKIDDIVYADYALNGSQSTVLLKDPENDSNFFLAMEDQKDLQFNDVQIAITSTTNDAVKELPAIPDFVGKDEVSYTNIGTLAFEDNWPSTGDYDMNDVVINYKTTIVKKNSSIVRCVTSYSPVNNGATFTNGFGVQFDNLSKSIVDEV